MVRGQEIRHQVPPVLVVQQGSGAPKSHVFVGVKANSAYRTFRSTGKSPHATLNVDMVGTKFRFEFRSETSVSEISVGNPVNRERERGQRLLRGQNNLDTDRVTRYDGRPKRLWLVALPADIPASDHGNRSVSCPFRRSEPPLPAASRRRQPSSCPSPQAKSPTPGWQWFHRRAQSSSSGRSDCPRTPRACRGGMPPGADHRRVAVPIVGSGSLVAM